MAPDREDRNTRIQLTAEAERETHGGSSSISRPSARDWIEASFNGREQLCGKRDTSFYYLLLLFHLTCRYERP
jgi:hypothetical protein